MRGREAMADIEGKKSWWLDDAAKLAREFPYTCHKPSSVAVRMLKPKDEAKLIFRFDGDDPGVPNAERMWVGITGISGRSGVRVRRGQRPIRSGTRCIG